MPDKSFEPKRCSRCNIALNKVLSSWNGNPVCNKCLISSLREVFNA